MNFKNIDLNLLAIFDALYRHRNGTVAAKSLGMAQPNLCTQFKRHVPHSRCGRNLIFCKGFA